MTADRSVPAEAERLADGYDAADDIRASIEFAYSYIRERAATGGKGWRDWPERAA
jgi:hypothetical protein